MTNDGWNSKWPNGLPDNPEVTKALTKLAEDNWVTGAYKNPNDYGLGNGDWKPKGVAIAPTQSANTAINTKWVQPKDWLTHEADIFNVVNWPKASELTAWDLGAGERTILTTFDNDGIKHKIINQKELKSQGSNLVDNEAYLYFQCDGCDEILDPHTKSFKSLEDARFNAGWKVKWNVSGIGYKVYCVRCGEKV